jgi:aspartyl-tRNA(Asn)/glutamyl-tRNA(Gln) amidotransferase subunit C
MTKITREDVLKLARLARLSLTDEEVVRYTREIAEIFHYVDKLQAADTEGLEPTYQVTGLTSVTRPDEVIDYGTQQSALMSNAPHSEDAHFKVKRMIG